MEKVTAAMLGAGDRGMGVYGSYALDHPRELQFIGVAEPDPSRRSRFQSMHQIHDDNVFFSWEELLSRPQFADAVLICVQDHMHYEAAVKAMERGYHILMEKPISNNLEECIALEKLAKSYDKVFSVCHVLRYTDFFSMLKKLVDESSIGKLISIQHNENVGYWHQAHSFVRGNWRNAEQSSPMILAKCCHDMDILLWLAGADCRTLSSFGSLAHFKSENAPIGAPERCLDGCPAERDCPYHAAKIYLTDNTDWPTSVISSDPSLEARAKALMEGPYGQCVYRCDNNVVDHQVVNMEFANGVTAVFTMCAFTHEFSRTIKLMGTKGEIRGHMGKNEIEFTNFNTGAKQLFQLASSSSGHGGGDANMMYDFVRLLQGDRNAGGKTAISRSVQSHVMAFAAEASRLQKKIINLEEFVNSQGGNAM